MKILHPAEYRRMPWKNGAGETTEIAIWPAGAGLDGFDWRVSIAPVKSDGAFSTFAGIDRTLCILEGVGMRLAVGDRPPTDVTPSSAPLSFSGDALVSATLIAGNIIDLNVMTRRDGYDHDVRRLHYRGVETVTPQGAPYFIYCHSGAVSVATPNGVAALRPQDTFVEPSPEGVWTLTAKVPSVIFLISITAHAPYRQAAAGGTN